MEILAATEDGNFHFVLVKPDRIEDAIKIIKTSYYVDETMLKSINFNKFPEAMKDFEVLLVKFLNEGNSVLGIETSTGKVACVSINALQLQHDEFFENHINNLNNPMSIFLANYIQDLDNSCDLMQFSKNKCLFEIIFAATLPEYRGKGLAKKLFEVSVDVAQQLYSANKDVTTSEPVADVVTSFCSHLATQKIVTSLGFRKVADIDLNKWSYMGKTTGERLGIEKPVMTVNYLVLI